MGRGNPKEKKNRIDYITGRLIEDKSLRFKHVWPEYELVYGMSKQTFQGEWKAAKEAARVHNLDILEAKKHTAIQLECESIRKSIKTKNERVLILQKQVEALRKQLKEGTTADYGMVNGFHIPFERDMNIREYNDTRRTLREIQAEISKIEGDYAPEKHIVETLQPILSDDFYEQNEATKLIEDIEDAEIIEEDE